MKPGVTLELMSEVLIEGVATGSSLVLDDALSFWGGYDPLGGRIIDVHHPQYEQKVTGRIVFIPKSRGSAGTPGGIAETLRNGSGPAAFVLAERDVNISIGVLVANRLYGLHVPVVQIGLEQMRQIGSGVSTEITASGMICLSSG